MLLGMAAMTVLVAGVVRAEEDKDLAKLEGEWTLVSSERDGKKAPDDDLKGTVRTVKGDTYTITKDDKTISQGKLKVDTSKKPATMDIIRENAKPMLGIYEIDGDTQKVCFAAPGKDRPTEFAAKAGSGYTLSVWKKK
jgi:uncharacterized protein (TIGR03067 family)